MKAGYGIFAIGHSKDKSFKEKNGEEYTMLSCSLTNDYSDIFMDMADLITFLTVERNIDVTNKTITDKQVFMNFRSDTIACGGRFKHLPDKVPWGAENYLSVFEDAVKSSMNNPNTNLKAIEEQQLKDLDESANKFIQEEKQLNLSAELERIRKEMNQLIQERKISTQEIMSVFAKNEVKTITQCESMEKANKIYEEDLSLCVK